MTLSTDALTVMIEHMSSDEKHILLLLITRLHQSADDKRLGNLSFIRRKLSDQFSQHPRFWINVHLFQVRKREFQ